MKTKYPYKTIAIAGTFDRLHKGHEYFLSQSFQYGRKVIIGLTSDLFVAEKIKNPASPAGRQKSKVKTKVNNYKQRKKELENFLIEKKLLHRAEIVKINDVYGPATTDDRIEALIVTADSYKGGLEVNRKRLKYNKKALQLIRVALIKAEDKKTIASTRIRIGEIDRWGKAYLKLPLWGHRISENLRKQLKKPIGLLIKSNGNNREIETKIKEKISKMNLPLLITVGDEVTKLYNQLKRLPDIAIVDFFVQRKKKYNSLEDLGFITTSTRGPLAKAFMVRNIRNPAGMVTKVLVSSIKDSFYAFAKGKKQQVIVVDGEEDLAALPAILLAPLGSLIVYGQPNAGIVLVDVTEDIKKRLKDFMEN